MNAVGYLYTVTIEPYSVGVENLKRSFSYSAHLTLAGRVQLFTVGVCLFIPALNVIILVTMRFFNTIPSDLGGYKAFLVEKEVPAFNREVQQIPFGYDISASQWLGEEHIRNYLLYLAATDDRLHTPNADRALRPNQASINRICTDMERCKQTNKRYVAYAFNTASVDESHYSVVQKMKIAVGKYDPTLFEGGAGWHWTLVLIDREERVVKYYDSMGHENPHVTPFLTTIAQKITPIDRGDRPYTYTSKIHTGIQNDGYNCGVWLLFMLKMCLEHPEFDLNMLDIKQAQVMIDDFRIQLMFRLLQMRQAIRDVEGLSREAFRLVNPFFGDQHYNTAEDRLRATPFGPVQLMHNALYLQPLRP